MRRSSAAHIVGLALALVPACKKDPPPTAEEPKALEAPLSPTAGSPQAAPAADQPAAAAPATASGSGASRVSESQFEVALTSNGDYETGKEGAVVIVLDAKAPFHVNDQYPIKFKTKESPGVKFSEPVVGKDKAKIETMRATLPVAFVPASKGQHTVAGQLAFSVCTDENCLMEKRDLSLIIDVK